MTILFLTMNPFSQYPVYKRAVGMGSALAESGNKVYITVQDCLENRKRFAAEAPGCTPLWIPEANKIFEIWLKLRLIWRLKADCIFSTSHSFRNLMGLSWLFPRHSKYVIEICELYSGFRCFGLLKEYAIAFEADGVLCASRCLKNVMEWRSRFLHLNRRLIYQPYAIPSHLKAGTEVLRNAIVYMAYMSKVYGCFEVVHAFAKLHQRHPDLVLEVLGSGPDLDILKNWIRSHGCENYIFVRGFVPEDELSGYFSRAVAFLSPMRNVLVDLARCPSKIFHYLPYGKPIVTCKLGNPYDVLGEYGIYYEPGNVESLVQAIENAIVAEETFQYPAKFLKENGWDARAKEFLTWLSEELDEKVDG